MRLRHPTSALLTGLCLALAAACSSAPPPPDGAGITVAISPATTTVAPGGTVAFSATVTGSAETRVTWSVREASGGSITAAGLYTAPPGAGTFHVVVTSVADAARQDVATVTVKATSAVTVTVSPPSPALQTGATQQFTAVVTGAANGAVSWSVTEPGGGAITSGGLYTAPAGAGSFHVVATSAADSSKQGTATVTVSSGPATALGWSDPAGGMYQLKKDAAASTPTHLVLDLIGAGAPTGAGIAFTLSTDPAVAAWAKVSPADPELIQGGAVLSLGTGVQALRGKASGALLQGVVGQKGLAGAVALNGVLARVAVDLVAGAAKGVVALSATKAQVLQGDGTIAPVSIAVGVLTAQ